MRKNTSAKGKYECVTADNIRCCNFSRLISAVGGKIHSSIVDTMIELNTTWKVKTMITKSSNTCEVIFIHAYNYADFQWLI